MEWRKTDEQTFELFENHQHIGTLKNSRKDSHWQEGGSIYHCQLKNYWKQQYELTDDWGRIVGKINPKNWYSSSSILTLNGESYHLKFVNDPLATLQLINQEGKVLIQARITTEAGRAKSECMISPTFISKPAAFWLASIVWSRFSSIAQSECGDETATLVLLLAQ